MKRDLMDDLVKWKNKKNRKPLVIRGARQTGKTWLMKEFGRTCFSDTVYINFDQNDHIKALFDGDLDPKRLLLGINAETGKKTDPEKTLIIFDEIQECPRALTSLKYFCEDAPENAIVAAGSQMGVALHEGTSNPVGKTDRLLLFPMSFLEFLDALGQEALANVIKKQDQEMIRVFRDKLMDFLRQYYYVGGMPEAVKTFAETQDFTEVRTIHKDLLDFYQQDFSKHAKPLLTERLMQVFHSIPAQLAKENRKFIYGQIRKGARAKDFELALQWLSDSGLIHMVHNVSKPGYPLKAYEEPNSFKVYLLDIGLLGAMGDISSQTIINGNQIFTEFKGAMTEQFVLQEMKTFSSGDKYYFSAKNAKSEIDFVLQGERDVIPVEVKAEENLRARSLKAYREKYNPPLSVRFSMSDFRDEGWLVNVPLYEVEWLKGLKVYENRAKDVLPKMPDLDEFNSIDAGDFTGNGDLL